MGDVTAITGEHIVLEGDTIEIESIDLELAPDFELVDDSPTDPYNTSTMKILHHRDFR